MNKIKVWNHAKRYHAEHIDRVMNLSVPKQYSFGRALQSV